MKIIFVSNALKVGGAEKFLLNIINGFAARGYQPVLFILDDDNPLMPVLDKSIKTYIFKKKFRYDIGISLKIRRAILREKATKVICIEIYPFFLSKLLFQFNNKIKFYISLHNSLPIHKKQHIFDIAYLKVFRKPDTAIFICNYQKDCFRKKYNFNPFKSVVIYNGIDTHFFSSSSANNEISPELFRWKEKIGLPEISKTILMIGRLSREKAHIFAFEALSLLNKQLPVKAHLVIVGTGPDNFLKILQDKCRELGIENVVHFLGGSSEVRPYLLTADIFTLTSFSETFSIAALEAMSCGIPCSLTRVGGAPEMIVNDQIGVLSETRNPESIADSWNTLLSRSMSREYISNYTASHFSLDKMMNEYISLIGQS